MHGLPASPHLKYIEIIEDYWYKYNTGCINKRDKKIVKRAA